MTTEERNNKVKEILTNLKENAMQKETKYIDDICKAVDPLFETSTWGFRELALVIVIGMKLDKKYKASVDLYNCSPRALYEGPIREFLTDNQIPHRKSGPLNIAKSTKKIDEAWASHKRPTEYATILVELVKKLESDTKNIDAVGVRLIKKYLDEVAICESLKVTINPTEDPENLYRLSSELISKVPDGGNTPQKVIGLLLHHYNEGMNTGVVVSGSNDSATVTNTTSKKPGDIIEESTTGEIYKVYEITVKQFDTNRIQDSCESVEAYNNQNNKTIQEIIVICRKKDCPPKMNKSGLNLCLGKFSYRFLTYYFWDINETISQLLQKMTASSRKSYFEDLNNYIGDYNTNIKVKEAWKNLIDKNTDLES